MTSAEPIRIQLPGALSGLPCRRRVPKHWAILYYFPRPQAVSWMGSGGARIRTGAHMGSQRIQGEDFSCLAMLVSPPETLENTQLEIQSIGPRAVAQVVKVLALHARDPIWEPVLIPAALLPIQLPACGPGKQLRTAQGFGTLHPCGRPGRGSWLRIGSAPAVAAT